MVKNEKNKKKNKTIKEKENKIQKISYITNKQEKKNKFLYFDNNGTTIICPKSEKIMIKWLKCYNPSSNSKISNDTKKIIDSARNYIHKHCDTGGPDKYVVLFTSGGTESNCAIIRMIVNSYQEIEKPHIVTSEIEHHSILACLHDLKSKNIIDVSYIKPTIHGVITPESVKDAIKENTCLVSIMYANNELGTINDIKSIAKVVHESSGKRFRIPFHTDAVQLFGKYRIKVRNGNSKGIGDLDAISVSSHKFYGPKGIGFLIINQNVIKGFNLKGIINGSQQFGLRGGTENVPAIIASIEAIKYSFINRANKNKKLLYLKDLLLERLSKSYKFADYRDYIDYPNDKDRDFIELLLLGPTNYIKKVLPNTILLSIIKNKGKNFCNIKFKNKLNKEGIIVSIGSTCLTSDKKASHVLESIAAPDIVKRGVLRISFGDDTKISDVKKLSQVLIKLLKEEK